MIAAHRREVTFLKAAKDDVGRLYEDAPDIARHALSKVRDLAAGRVEGQPLQDLAKGGDLGDCHKLYFGLGNPPSHRIVYRHIGRSPQKVEILEIVAIESRTDMYVYLLAAARLGRIPVETKPHFNRLQQEVIASRADKRKRPRPPR